MKEGWPGKCDTSRLLAKIKKLVERNTFLAGVFSSTMARVNIFND